MTNPDTPDERDLDLVAALAANMLGRADSDRAKKLISGNARFADEHAAQLLAIAALDGNECHQPLTDIEKAYLSNYAVPKAVSQKPTWPIGILKPLSIAAVAIVIVGFAGIAFTGGGTDMETTLTDRLSNQAEQPETDTEARSIKTSAVTAASTDPFEGAAVATDGGSLSPKFGFPIIPPEGNLKVLHIEEFSSIEDFMDLQQWIEPVALSRYVNLECWPDAANYNNVLGVSLSNALGIDYEIVRTTEAVETRAVQGCEATIIHP